MDSKTNKTVRHHTHRRPTQPTLQRLFAFLALALSLTLLAGPALAQDQGQGKKKGHDKDQHRHAHQHEDGHHDDDSDAHRMVMVSDDDSDLRMRLDSPRGERMIPAGTQIIALEAHVTDLDTGREQVIDLDRADDHARIQVGDRVRVDLVGTAIIDGDGVAVQVPADFDIAAGSWRIDTTPAGPSSVIVTATQPNSVHRGNPQGRSGVGFEVERNYDMKAKYRKGRVTFEIADRDGDFGPGGNVGAPAQGWQPDARWRHAEEIADDLSQIDFNPDGLDRAEVELIYERGLAGIREVAVAQAVRAGRSGAVRARDGADVVAHAYRHLLGRQGNTRAIAQADPQGFRNNLELLQNRGYRALVTLFVDSDEFRRVHDLDTFDDLPRGEVGWDDGADDRYEDYRRARDTRPN